MTESTSTPPPPAWWPENPYPLPEGVSWQWADMEINTYIRRAAYAEALQACWAQVCDWVDYCDETDFAELKDAVERHRYYAEG